MAGMALLDAAYASVTAILFAFVALRIARRPIDAPSRLAQSMFATWWYGVAVFLAMGAALSLMDWANAQNAALTLVLSSLSMLSVCVAVWGLVFYVTYVYTGRSTIFIPSLIFYACIYGLMLYAIARDPTGAEATAWHQSVVRLAIVTGPLLSAAIVAFLAPALAALMAYGSLYKRLESRAQKFRVALTTTSLVAWFGLAILAYALGVTDTPAWTIAARIAALAAATGVLTAHAPPAWLSRRLHLEASP